MQSHMRDEVIASNTTRLISLWRKMDILIYQHSQKSQKKDNKHVYTNLISSQNSKNSWKLVNKNTAQSGWITKQFTRLNVSYVRLDNSLHMNTQNSKTSIPETVPTSQPSFAEDLWSAGAGTEALGVIGVPAEPSAFTTVTLTFWPASQCVPTPQ